MKKKRFETRTQLILYFLQGAKKYFFSAILFACLVSLLDLLNPKIISYTVDAVLDNKPEEDGFVSALMGRFGDAAYLRSHLWIIALVVLITAVLSAFCRFMCNLFNNMGAERLVRTMRDSLFDHILRLPFAWHSENQTGDIIQRCTSDVEQIKMFLSEQLLTLFRFIVMIVLTLYFMFSIHAGLAAAAAAFIPIIVGYSLFFHTKIGASFSKVDIEEGKLSSIAQENLTGVRVVRAFNQENYEKARFEKQNKKYTGMWVTMMRLMARFWTTRRLW